MGHGAIQVANGHMILEKKPGGEELTTESSSSPLRSINLSSECLTLTTIHITCAERIF